MLHFRLSAKGNCLRFHATRDDDSRVVSGAFFLGRSWGFIHGWTESSVVHTFEKVEEWFAALN